MRPTPSHHKMCDPAHPALARPSGSGEQLPEGYFHHNESTSGFKKTASDYVKDVHQKVILVDGERLAYLMIEHNIGVSLFHSYEIKKINGDPFGQE
jgi:restriction endonuclease Mrr